MIKRVSLIKTASITSKGRVTIPAEVRNALGLKPRDRVTFEVDRETGTAILRRVGSIADAYGAVQARSRPEDFSPLRAEFERGVADEVTER
jgi:AbrB family looped-hinge helix DNA binding protein